jgi:signal transduction histidine kinase/HAMP domain-containing protein
MRVSLKAKLTALISFLVLVVILATSSLYLSSLTRQALSGVESKAEYVASEIYHQARAALARSRLPPGTDPSDLTALRDVVQATLAADAGLASLLESAVGYSPTVYYVTITDAERRVLVHSNPAEIGRTIPSAPVYRTLLEESLPGQLRAIYGPPRLYEIRLALDLGGKPLGDVRVGVSTLFLRGQITPDLRRALALTALAILFATASAAVLSYRLLRPLATISQSVERMARGEYPMTLPVRRSDEWGILSSKLNLLGEQMRGEKAAFVALKENLDQLLANLADGLLLFDRHDRLVLATPAVEHFLRRLPDSSRHPSVTEVFSAHTQLDRLILDAFRARKPLAEEAVGPAGETETPRATVSLEFVESEGDPVGSLVTLRDPSTRARLEDHLDIAAKLAALGRLTSGVAHEVKNPLNAMVLQLEILRAKLPDEGELVKPQLDILGTEIRRLDRVVKTFLDFTRPLELRRAETDLESLVQEVFTLAEPYARENNVRLTFAGNGALPTVLLDPDLMKQALLNLVMNGCQAMPRGGELRIAPRVLPDSIEMEISDQGVGIPPECQDKVFSLYFTTKPGGTGVGLAMTYRILQLHNGAIEFTSEVNQGTTFRIRLPR